MSSLFSRYSRDCPYSGLWLGLLVPFLLLRTGQRALAIDMLTSVTVLFLIFMRVNSVLFISAGVYSSSLLTCIFDNSLSFRSAFVLGFTVCCTRSLLRLFPKTFTIGEALLLVHLLIVFIHSSPLFLIVFICSYIIEQYAIPCTPCSVLLAFLSVLFLVSSLLTHLSPDFCSLYKLKFQHFFTCFLIWSNFLLLIVWSSLLLLCICITWMYRQPASTQSENEEYAERIAPAKIFQSDGLQAEQSGICDSDPFHFSSSNDAISDTICRTPKRLYTYRIPRTPFWLRKVFHFAIGLVFTLGLFYSPQLLSFSSACLLIAFGLFEWMRRRGPKRWTRLLSGLVDPFRDERDSGALIFTPISLLLGLSIPVWWPMTSGTHVTVDLGVACSDVTTWTPSPLAWSGVLSIAVGDSMAALVGRAWGRRRWPGSHRTLLGSIASWTSQLALWLPVARIHRWYWPFGLAPITVGVLTEAYTEQIDNLTVPLVVMTMFLDTPSA
ncbi:Dolichol kinase [Paragonimus skrjabini miyazakii]|uniref:dolichol kinase n=1 Tax=Paragonimus skrjabini miyazakii TaxID=59628 RepID=A0A8S9YRH7_9TREM|nr:Dolichol kinase [Paragonimus skrjabini miyazakii]